MNTTAYSKTIVVLLCMCVALLGMIVVDSKMNRAEADVDSGNGYIAVAVNYASSTQQLWLCKVTGEHKAIMVYECKGGSKVRLIGVRRIDSDGEIIAYNEGSDKGLGPADLEKGLEKMNKQETEGR
ncbi:MAG: hypothetical protein AABZ60_03985 [Planctomycetota bacterium]